MVNPDDACRYSQRTLLQAQGRVQVCAASDTAPPQDVDMPEQVLLRAPNPVRKQLVGPWHPTKKRALIAQKDVWTGASNDTVATLLPAAVHCTVREPTVLPPEQEMLAPVMMG